ncbi:glycosyltransferase family 4 protein [Lentzea aerocolonigenes]|uniref:glycosyltransferase family 4 protein n=1 Tax=Lentzea aerocolonigenes TaxID=68170 RepID=UPI0004C44BD6|nr:glycosyltransferase family 1 protein [Lentzea aerocolonigenes]MCP2250021.1 Glycosyltransferase involved in cell wall bisynthesis [Lentzea aerocolonigenes]
MPELVLLTEQLNAPVPGGTGRYTAELLKALVATAPDGWSVTTAATAHADRVIRVPRRALVALWERGLPPRLGPHVHAPTPLAPLPGAVVTVHDVVPWTHPETLTPRGVAWHRKVIAKAAVQARALVVPTRAVASQLEEHVRVEVPVHVVPNGVTRLVGSRPADLPDRYVLAIGTIEPRKGFDLLVRATERLGVPLVVIGPQGWGGVDLRAPHVTLLGKVSDERLASVLAGATVLAAPSLAEGFGLPVLEAMAAGVAVVHSDDPALVEVAGGAGTVVRRGDLASLTEGLRAAIADPHHTAEAGVTRASDFTWEKTALGVWAVHARRPD